MNNIIIVTGGSGGHIFPAVSLAEELNKYSPNINVIFISPKRGLEERIISRTTFQHIKLQVSRPSISLSIFKTLIEWLEAFFRCRRILKDTKPSVVIGFGAYVCIPVMLAAFFSRIPTILHEQNVLLGKANQCLSLFVRKIAVSFPQTKELVKNPFIRNKIIVTGNPIRQDYYSLSEDKCLNFFGFLEGKFNLLIFGGSQGSLNVNKLVKECLANISQEKINQLQIIHVIGNDDKDGFERFYKSLGINSKVFNFLNEISFAYRIADTVVSRAGATTIAELASYKKRAVFIPYPFARNHQFKNVKFLENGKTVFVVQENKDAQSKFSDIIQSLIGNNSEPLEKTSEFANFDHRYAAKNLSKEVLALC